jgi:diguanylate cyclase (GGDEF)-like protein
MRARRASGAVYWPVPDEVHAAYRAQLRSAARESTLLAGVIAIVAFPSWAVFDFVLLPDKAVTFLMVRLGFTVAIALAWLALRSATFGRRWPQQTAFVLVLLPEIGIAWMIPRSLPHLEAYLLGFTLAIFASAFAIEWAWQLTLLLVTLTFVATGVFVALTRPLLGAGQIATIGFYLGTASALAVVAQIYRHRSGWQRFVIERSLEAEHRRNQALLAELTRMTREDALTGVANRRAWEERLADEVARARRAQMPFSIIYCDFDHFKDVNDRSGHALGDQVLCAGAALMAERLRATDYLARLGGDEFAIACPGASLASAARVASDLVAEARTAEWPSGIGMTFSLGVAELHPDDLSTDDLSSRADAALYQAKRTRNRVATERDIDRPTAAHATVCT